MAALVEALRIGSVAVFAAPLLLRDVGPVRGARRRPRHGAAARVPLLANIAAFGVFFPALVVFRTGPEGPAALILAATGCLLALAGAIVVVRSRMELGPAWSLVPMADEAAGLVTSGPFGLVRHPIYLGFLMVAAGQALAFASWPALVVLLGGIVPSFLWRAGREERMLSRVFGERYERYRRRTPMIIPRLL
jgi:protein-S-isoprenylcysteine O-methyltransferase Ste14